jgi:4'-phosphopantetheinyl transferase
MTQVILLPRADWASDRSILSAVEQRRLDTITHLDSKARFLAARCRLRRALAPMLAVSPQEVPLEIGPNGRPFLVGHRLEFSVSHSANLVALALRHDGAVGIDVEAVNRPRPSQRLIERYFSESEQALDPLIVWTAKEALIKARGQRVPEALKAIQLTRHDERWSIAGAGWTGWRVTTTRQHGYWVSLAEGPTTPS